MTDHFKACAQVLDVLRGTLADVLRERETLRHALVGHNHVVRTSPGLYLLMQGDHGVVTGVTRCSRFTQADARALADATTDGAGHKARAVLLKDALDDEAPSLLRLIATLEA